jgi:signal transduction histidine kinase
MTAAFACAMVVVLAAAGLFVYLRMRAQLDESIDSGLRTRADDVAALVTRTGGGLSPLSGRPVDEPEESLAQLLTSDGRVVGGTGGAGKPALPAGEARRASRGPIVLERRVPGIEGTARLVAHPVSANGRSLVVVAGSSLADRDEALSSLIASFAIGMPLAVLAASGFGYLLATTGLAPVEAMRRRAERVSLVSRGERLPLPRAHDEIHRLGETLNEMLARLEASFERERRFVADASHELRTPLAVLKTELEAALASGVDDEPVRESLVAAVEETDHLAQLAEDLLLIARAAEGRLPVRPETVEVRDLLEQARQRFIERARQQGRVIRVRAPEGLRCGLDPLRLRQALGNLIDNALRHGAGAIDLTARRQDGGVEVEISDHGPGFSPEMAPRAFERFARGGGARARGGGGLGLAIVRAITEAHGGTATIAGGSSPGATVRLRFPASRPAAAASHLHLSGGRHSEGTSHPKGGDDSS